MGSVEMPRAVVEIVIDYHNTCLGNCFKRVQINFTSESAKNINNNRYNENQ